MDDELRHHGVIGMHWGVRRYQPYPSDYHGNGRFLGKAGAKAKATAGRVVKYAGDKAKAGVTKARARHTERKAAEFIAKGGVGNRKKMAKLSAEELDRVQARLEKERTMLQINAEMRKNRYSSQLVERVLNRSADAAVDLTFDVLGTKVKGFVNGPSALERAVAEAENRAKIAKSIADEAGSRQRLISEQAQAYNQEVKRAEQKKARDEYFKTGNQGSQGPQQQQGSQQPSPNVASKRINTTAVGYQQKMAEKAKKKAEKEARYQENLEAKQKQISDRAQQTLRNAEQRKAVREENRKARNAAKEYEKTVRFEEKSSSSWDDDDFGTAKTLNVADNKYRTRSTSTHIYVPSATPVSSVSSTPTSTAKSVVSTSSSVSTSSRKFQTGSSKGQEYVKIYVGNGDGTATGSFPDARYKSGSRTETIDVSKTRAPYK